MASPAAFTIEPVSTAGPTAADLKENEMLIEYLRDNGLYESEEEMATREEVLIFLLDLVRKWVRKVAAQKGMSELEIDEANANLYTFGSYQLGVHGPGDDIDTHCIGPKWCERHGDFFGTNPWCLQQLLAESAWVTKLQAVPDAFVPVLKLEIRGIDIDLTYAQLPMAEVPTSLNLQDNNILRAMDEESVTSINGCRVTDKIGKLVPNKEAFKHSLKYLKLWGKRRGVYSNVMGFLGGVNFAILVARVCMLYPNACAATIVRRFFLVMSTWDWSAPIMIAGIEHGGPMSQMVWSPHTNRKDSTALFPIITPCYPASNSTFNVSECTKTIMLAEFQRGRDAVTAARGPLDHAALAEAVVFFAPGGYLHYLQVTVAAASAEDFAKWSGYMTSRIKHLASKIHLLQGAIIARPWPKEFLVPREHCLDGRPRSLWFIGLKRMVHANAMSQFANKRVDLRLAVQDFKSMCLKWKGHSMGMTVDVDAVKFDSLPGYLFKDGVHPNDAPKDEPHAAPKEEPTDAGQPPDESVNEASVGLKRSRGSSDAVQEAVKKQAPTEFPGDVKPIPGSTDAAPCAEV